MVRLLSVRKLTIIIAIALVILVAVATAVSYYAASGEHNDPVKTAPAP